MKKKIVYDDSCQFCIGATKKVFNSDYQLIGASKLNKTDKKKLAHLDLSKEIVMIDKDGTIKRNIDVFMDTKDKDSLLHKITNFKPIHFTLRQIYKFISIIRYRLK